MSDFINIFKKEVLKLKNKKVVDQNVLKIFLRFLNSNKFLTKEKNPTNHICTFFLPININTKSIYLVHHIKANDWIPPGGHIKLNETPLGTIRREFEEELDWKLTNEKIELFNISIKDVGGNPKHTCVMHYDIWYLVFTDLIDFKFTRVEFYDAAWFKLNQGIKKVKLIKYREIISRLSLIF